MTRHERATEKRAVGRLKALSALQAARSRAQFAMDVYLAGETTWSKVIREREARDTAAAKWGKAWTRDWLATGR